MLGDVLNPTAGTALDCGLFAGGVFKGPCWCLSAPWACSDADYKAAYALAHPDVYAPILPAPGLPAVSGGYSTVQLTPGEYDDQVADAWLGWSSQVQLQNAATMNQTAANLDAISKPSMFDSLPVWVWIAGAAGLALVIGGLRR